jgi:hypothetical protein
VDFGLMRANRCCKGFVQQNKSLIAFDAFGILPNDGDGGPFGKLRTIAD